MSFLTIVSVIPILWFFLDIYFFWYELINLTVNLHNYMCALFLVLPCINVIYVDDFRVIVKGKNAFVEVAPNLSPSIKFKLQVHVYQMCHFFQTYLNSRYICLRYLTIF